MRGIIGVIPSLTLAQRPVTRNLAAPDRPVRAKEYAELSRSPTAWHSTTEVGARAMGRAARGDR